MLKCLLWWFCFFAFFWKPLVAQTIPPDFHEWFLEAVAGKSFNQQTLEALQPELACVGSQLTPPNTKGERTKIYDPNARQWVRVGFGEGEWVWLYQGTTTPPNPVPCAGTPSPDPSNLPTLIDYARVQAIIRAEVQRVYDQNERIHANAVARDAELSKQIKAHDEAPGYFVKIFGRRDVQVILGAIATCAATQCWQRERP